jgi:hypothetical protein
MNLVKAMHEVSAFRRSKPLPLGEGRRMAMSETKGSVSKHRRGMLRHFEESNFLRLVFHTAALRGWREVAREVPRER